jgi:hypothetical protein
MRPGAARNQLAGIFMVVVGAVGIYFGYFYSGTVCDSSSSACHSHAAFTVEPVPMIVGAVFLVFGIYTVLRARRSRNVRAPAVPGVWAPGTEWQARLGREMAAFFTRSVSEASPREFDKLMLALLDGVEGNAGDIDARIEAVRLHLQAEGLLHRWRDQGRANAVWRKGDELLPWIPETWQLRTRWARLRVLGPTVASYTIAPAWVAPTDAQPEVPKH